MVVKRIVVGAVLVVALVVSGAQGVGAKVHGVSQAGCAHNPAESGANNSGTHSPSGPIPVTSSATGDAASGGAAAPESGGDGDPQCDTEANEAREDK